MTSPTVGSQLLLQRAIGHRPELLRASLLHSGALARGETVAWRSPLADDAYREYRDGEALRRLGIATALRVPLSGFWPARGPVWDALGVVSPETPLLLEAKAHIAEAASPRTRASATSKLRIGQSLLQARRHYAPRSSADWSTTFYQYANRLAWQYFLRKKNGIGSRLVFLYFTNATDVGGPSTEDEWHGALRLLHAQLGLPVDLQRFGVYEAFLDARSLRDAA